MVRLLRDHGDALVTQLHDVFSCHHASVKEEDVIEVLIDQCGLRSPSEGVLTLPPEVEICIRKHPVTGSSFWFLLNYAGSPKDIHVRGTYASILTGKSETGSVILEPYGVMILGV